MCTEIKYEASSWFMCRSKNVNSTSNRKVSVRLFFHILDKVVCH